MTNILRDMTGPGKKTRGGGETFYIRICNQCDPSTYPKGKPILPTDMKAKKDDKTGQWYCSECVTEEENKRMLKLLGPQHFACQAFIKEEDNAVRKYNDAARRLNEVSGQYLMSYKRNRYTGSMPLSSQ
jgi:hypothetical protein